MTRSDILSVCSVIVGVSSLVTAVGFPDAVNGLFGATAGHYVLLGIFAAGIIAAKVNSVLSNPSPPAGSVSANIPIGSIPVVSASPGSGIQTVALATAGSVESITPATQRPIPNLVAVSAPQKGPS